MAQDVLILHFSQVRRLKTTIRQSDWYQNSRPNLDFYPPPLVKTREGMAEMTECILLGWSKIKPLV